MTVTHVKPRLNCAEAPKVTDLDSERSLHYVDGQGQPLDVRPWYRYWVLSFGAISAFLVVSIISSPGIAGFDMGAREGGPQPLPFSRASMPTRGSTTFAIATKAGPTGCEGTATKHFGCWCSVLSHSWGLLQVSPAQ